MRVIVVFLFITQFAFAQKAKVKLHSFHNSTCDQESDPDRLRTRIISKVLVNGILTIHVATTATCCVDFVPKTKYAKGVLDLDFLETGEPCECGCCYEFVYEISGIKNSEVKITFMGKQIEQSYEKYKTYPVSFRIFKGDTINYVDKYGLRQGIWAPSADSAMMKKYLVFVDNRPVTQVRLYSNGQVERELIMDKISFKADGRDYFEYADYNRLVEYYESGQKKKECYNNAKVSFNSYEKGKCKEWNEMGELIYEGVYRK
jgi:hypothetical protein